MKKHFILRSLSFMLLVSILISCSKENIAAPGTDSEDAVSGKPGVLLNQKGNITGQINPVGTKAKLVLLDTQGREYGPFYADLRNGSFSMYGLVPGTYKLVIEYPFTGGIYDIQNGYTTLSIEVIVGADATTDVGVINCP